MARFLVVLLACLVLTACGTDGPSDATSGASGEQANDGSGGTDRPDGSEPRGTVTVLAAASLTESFERIADGFERRHPDISVRTSFGASSTLARQIEAGAPADVFASASPDEFERVDTVGEPRVFVRNRLQLAVPASNPAGIRRLADLTRPGLRVAFCAPEVPCGDAAEQALQAANLRITPDTLGNDVKKVATLVRLGEVDAGLVYRTDVIAAGDEIEGIDLPGKVAAPRDYPVALLPGAPNPEAGRAFRDYLDSPTARRVFSDAGFEPA